MRPSSLAVTCGNSSARRLYERAGFKPMGEPQPLRPGSKLLAQPMRLPLGGSIYGGPPDIPTWGRILFDTKDNLDFAPHWAMFPETAIFLVLSINCIGEGLRDAFDPRKVRGK
jgi:hypothetical protein